MPRKRSNGSLYRVRVLCSDSSCKLEDGIIRARRPDEAEAELRARMAAYPGKALTGVLVREDSVAPWLTLTQEGQP